MRVIKKKSKQTYVSHHTGEECHYYNYFIESDNGNRVQIKCVYKEDVKRLDMISVYER